MTTTDPFYSAAYQTAARAVALKTMTGRASRLVRSVDSRGFTRFENLNLAALRSMGVGDRKAAFRVDMESGTIFGASVATIGPCIGHGFSLDAQSLDLLRRYMIENGPDGTKCHYKHAEVDETKGEIADSLGTLIGKITNPRIVGRSLLGDVVFGAYASMLPGVGDAGGYLLSLADTDPASVGLSAVFLFDLEPVLSGGWQVVDIVARPTNCMSVDFVGTPAANPGGLIGLSGRLQRRVAWSRAYLRTNMFQPARLSALASTIGAVAIGNGSHRRDEWHAEQFAEVHRDLIAVVARDLLNHCSVDIV